MEQDRPSETGLWISMWEIASLSLGSVASEGFAPAIRFSVHRVAKVKKFLPARCGKRG